MPNLTLYPNHFIAGMHPNPLKPFYSYASSATCPCWNVENRKIQKFNFCLQKPLKILFSKTARENS